jgi:protein involved in temperature-dependent protein secretion
VSSVDELLACFPTRDYARCEQLATSELARGGDPILWWFLTHARVRTGRFELARSALDKLSSADPTKAQMARYYGDLVYREELEHRACNDVALLNELREFDFGYSAIAAAEVAHVAGSYEVARAILSKPKVPVRGRVTMTSGQTSEFSDLRDTDDLVGHHLPVYIHDRAMHLPFSSIRMISVAEDLRMFFFDDLWVPVGVTLHPDFPLQYVRARVPARYPGWPNTEDTMREGDVTMFDQAHGYRRAMGLRDYEMVRGDGTTLIGISQMRTIEFLPPFET